MLFTKRWYALRGKAVSPCFHLPLLLVELLEGAVHTGRLQHLPGRDLVSFSYSSGYIEWYASSRNSAFFVWLIHTFNTPWSSNKPKGSLFDPNGTLGV